MKQQQGILFGEVAPVDVTEVGPTGVPAVPFQGATSHSKHASWTGSEMAVRTWSEKTGAMLQVLASGSPMTRNELAAVLHWPINSVCSKLAGLLKQGLVVATDDYEIVTWPDGSTTKRERFTVRHGQDSKY